MSGGGGGGEGGGDMERGIAPALCETLDHSSSSSSSSSSFRQVVVVALLCEMDSVIRGFSGQMLSK